MKKKYGLLITICLLCCIAITGKLLGTLSVQASDSVVGDLTDDGNITEEDMNALRKHLTGEKAIPTDNLSNADVNGDTPTDANENSIDVRDLVRYKRYLTPASESLSGTGTEKDPFLISSVSDWYKFIEESQTGHLEGVYYQLTTDIEINIGNQSEWDSKKELLREWIPIGYGVESPYFQGTLLGEGHTVSGAYMQDEHIKGQITLFGYSASYKNVKKLNLTNSNMHYIESKKDRRISVVGTVTDSTIRYTPFAYTEGNLVFLGSGDATNYDDVCSNIIVSQLDDGTHWKVSNSTLVSCDASITIDGETTYYETLKTAVNAANNNTTKGLVVVINVLDTAVVDTGLEIKRDITIQNVAGKDVSITRGESFASHMFQVTGASDEDAVFTLQAQTVDGEGTLTIDGSSTVAVRGLTVHNDGEKTTFNLKEGVTLQNANSTLSGAALQNDGIANLRGNVCNNTSSDHGGAIRNTGTGTLNILGGNYSGNTSAKNGGVIYSNSKVNKSISIDNATFTGNNAAGGGVLYVTVATNTTIRDSRFTNNSATGTVNTQAGGGAIAFNGGQVYLYDTVMENNSADHTVRGGAAICIMGGARAELTNCTFTNNATIPGGTCDIWFAGDAAQHIRLHDDSFTGIVGWMENLTNTKAKEVRRYVSGTQKGTVAMTSGVRYQVSHDPLTLTEVAEDAPDYSASTKAMNFYAHRSTSEGTFAQSTLLGIVDVKYDSYVTEESFQEYKECGFNVLYPQDDSQATNGYWDGNSFDKSDLKKYMDLAAEVGLKYIVRDKRIKDLNNSEAVLVGTEAYPTIEALADKLEKYMELYIGHSAFYGIALMDEPKKDVHLQNSADLSRALEIVGKRKGVDIYVKSTLLPYAGDSGDTTFDSYKTYISNYIAASTKEGSALKILSYDDYPFLVDGFKADYYQTLQYNASRCNASSGTGLEIVAQSFSSENRRKPDLAELYLQNNVALAFGVKQMGYFTYWRASSNATDKFHSGILDYNGTKMLYDEVQEVIGYTQQMAKVILNFDYVKANFGYASDSAPNYFKGVSSATLDNVTATVTRPTIITQMQDSTNNRTGYMVVNVDSSHLENTAIDTVTLTFTDAKYVTKYSKSGTEIIKLNNGQLTLSLAEGEGAFLIPHN